MKRFNLQRPLVLVASLLLPGSLGAVEVTLGGTVTSLDVKGASGSTALDGASWEAVIVIDESVAAGDQTARTGHCFEDYYCYDSISQRWASAIVRITVSVFDDAGQLILDHTDFELPSADVHDQGFQRAATDVHTYNALGSFDNVVEGYYWSQSARLENGYAQSSLSFNWSELGANDASRLPDVLELAEGLIPTVRHDVGYVSLARGAYDGTRASSSLEMNGVITRFEMSSDVETAAPGSGVIGWEQDK